MATLELPDDVVRVLLKEFQVDPEEGGAIDAAARLKLLVLVLGKLQAMSHVVARFGSASQLDPAALPQLKSRKLCTEHFNKNALFSVQETVFRDDENKYGIWFELRQVLNAFVTGYVEQGISRLQMRAAGTAGEGLIAIVGARQAGELPLLELRCQFFTGPVPQAFAAAEAAMRPSEELMLVQKLQRGTLKLAGALLQANTAVLSEQYIDAQHAAWGPAGEQFIVSCLLPIQPLKGAVKLHRCCKVCGAGGDVMSCSRCKEVSYCSKDCQRQDWKRHKAECTAAAAAAGTSASSSAAAEGGSSSSSRPSVVVKLHEQHDMARFPIETVWNVQTPVKHILKANEKGPQWKDGHAPAVQRPADASKQFLVKIQAALDGPPGHPLLLYDEKRKVLTHVAKSDQARGTYDQLLAVIRTKGYLKAKLYFNAVLEEERQLRVLLDPLPSQTHPW